MNATAGGASNTPPLPIPPPGTAGGLPFPPPGGLPFPPPQGGIPPNFQFPPGGGFPGMPPFNPAGGPPGGPEKR